MLAGNGIGITGAASTVVRDNLAKNVVLVSNDKGKIAASPLSINSFQGIIVGGATTITDYDLTPNKVVISDADGKIGTSSVSNIEVGYLVGTNDLIQNQLNSKANQSTTYTKTEVDNNLSLKSDKLTTYTETSGDTVTLSQSFDSASPSTHITWQGNAIITNVSGSHQEINLNNSGAYIVHEGQTAGEKVYLTLELKAATLYQLAVAVQGGTYWEDAITFHGLSTDAWTMFSWSFDVPDNGIIKLILGVIPADVGAGSTPWIDDNATFQSGTLFLRNFHLYKSADLVTISAPLTCQKDLECDQSVLCKHLYADHGVTAEQVHIGGSTMTRGAAGELLWDGDEVALLQVGVAGVWYDAKRLSFNNAQSLFDASSSTLQIGAPLFQNPVRIGTSTVFSDLTRGSNAELLWDGQEVALVGSQPSLELFVNGSLVPGVTGLAFSNHSNGFDPNTGVLSIGSVLSQSLLRLGSNAVYGDLTLGSNNELLWNNNPMASEALVNQVQNDLQINLNATVAYVETNYLRPSIGFSVSNDLVATTTPNSISLALDQGFKDSKQDLLQTVSESTTDVVLLQSIDDSDLHIAWILGANASYTNQTGFQTITQASTTSGHILARPAGQVPVPGAALRFSVELKAGTKTEIVIHNDDVTNLSSRASFQQSLTNTWQTVTWDYGPTSTDRFSLYFGLTDYQYTQSPGTYYLRNLRVTQQDGIVVNFSQDVAITGQCAAEQVHVGGGSLLRGGNGELLWDGNAVASEALVATKQDALAHYTETSGAETVFAQSFDTNQFVSIHVFWTGPGSYTNYSGSHQELTLPALWLGYFSAAAGTKVYLSVDLRAGTLQDLVFASHVGTAWFDTITFQGLSSTEFRNYTWQFTIPANSTQFVMAVGIVPSNLGIDMSSTNQPAGTVDIRNLRLYTTSDLVTIDAPLRCEKDAFFSTSIESQTAYIRTITAGQYFSSSDERIKTDVQDASLEACLRIFDAVSPKVYERTDLPGKRIGFIAQDVQSSAPPEFANLWGTRPGADGEELLTIDYSRLITIAWAQLKLQQAQIADLTSRLEALEEAQ